MSASSIVSLRLDHLEKASQLLSTTSPATSGHLRSAQRRLAAGEGRPLSTPSHLRICQACGSSLVMGWNCERTKSNHLTEKRTRQDRLEKKKSNKNIDVRCSRCDNVTTMKSAQPPAANESKPGSGHRTPVAPQPAKATLSQPLEVPKVQPAGTPPATSGVKKRTRNKKSSLQSMLDNRKPAEASKGFGLGLADFMTG